MISYRIQAFKLVMACMCVFLFLLSCGKSYTSEEEKLLIESKDEFAAIRNQVDQNPAEILPKLHQLQVMAQKLNNDSLAAAVYERKMLIYIILRNADSAGIYLDKALEKRFPNDKEHRIVTYINASNYHFLRGQYDEILTDLDEVSKLISGFDGDAKRYQHLINIRKVGAYHAIGKLDSVLFYTQEALKYTASDKDKIDLYIPLGIAQTALPDYPASEKSFREAYRICIENKFYNSLSEICLNLSVPLSKQGKNDEAMMFLNEALELHFSGKSILPEEGIVAVYNNMAGGYIEKKEYRKALEVAKKALAINEELKLPLRFIEIYNNLVTIYVGMGETKEALFYAKKLSDLVEENDAFFDLKAEGYEAIAQAYQHAGNYREALQYREKMTQMRDSAYAKDRLVAIQELQTKYETEKKDLELQTAALKIKTHRTTTGWLIALLALLAILSALFFYFQRKKLQQQQLIIQQGQKVAELTSKTLAPNCGNDNNGNGLSDEKNNEILRQLRDGMETQKWYKNPALTLDMLAEALNTNRSYLSIVINSRMQKGFTEYINFHRVEEAKRLLQNTDDKIANIATEAGFGSSQTFYSTFKNFEQFTPAEYRKAMRHDSN